MPLCPTLLIETLLAHEPQQSINVPALASADLKTPAVAQPPSHTLCGRGCHKDAQPFFFYYASHSLSFKLSRSWHSLVGSSTGR